MIVQTVLRAAVQRLTAAGIDGAARDARVLIAAALGVEPSRVTLIAGDTMSDAARDRFDQMIGDRISRRPVSRILGRRSFWGRDFIITDDVLDPRGDTETLIAAALRQSAQHVLDLGTGSGSIAITLAAETPTLTCVATDISTAALDVAAQNAARHGVSDRVRFVHGSWFEPVTGTFDLIVSNPPYISDAEMQGLAPEVALFDPKMALTPGGDGLDPYRVIAQTAPRFLAAHGKVIVEIGHTQARDVTQIFEQAGFANIETLQDFEQKDRVVAANWPF